MVRRNEEQLVSGSSIVLLQERFKQLQKLKEMRQERQLLQLLPQPIYVNEEVGELRMNFSTLEAGLRDPLELGLKLNTSYNATWNQHQPCNQRMLTQQQQFPAAAASVRKAYNFFEKVDVDTLLRL